MNTMTDAWTTFGSDQGQIVERAYRYHAQTDRIWRRTRDRADGSVRFDSAPCPADTEWNGSEPVPPKMPRRWRREKQEPEQWE